MAYAAAGVVITEAQKSSGGLGQRLENGRKNMLPRDYRECKKLRIWARNVVITTFFGVNLPDYVLNPV